MLYSSLSSEIIPQIKLLDNTV